MKTLFDFKNLSLKQNLLSGFVIFLIALPLSVGISVASGAPPAAGILSAIIGGCLGSLLSGSHITINGAAAGLIVVVLEIIQHFSGGDPLYGFQIFLGISIVAGCLQMILGGLRLGILGLAVPQQALHGMMSAIGLTIVIKQLFVLGGIRPEAHSTISQLWELPMRLQDENVEILLLGLACLALILLVNRLPKVRRLIPPPLAAVLLGGLLSVWIDLEHEHFVVLFDHQYLVGPQYLLHVPERWQEAFIFPRWPEHLSFGYFSSILTLALIASIESQLSTNAVDRMDPLKRRSNLDRDLLSKGFCNIILGFIGGLPVISEIVRSSANVMSGATNRLSNFSHGLFIALFFVLFPEVLNKIPLTTFAAILIFVGFRLANLPHFVSLYRSSKRDFLVLTLTVVVTLSTDLLIGVLAGCLVELIFWLYSTKSLAKLFTVRMENGEGPSEWRLLGPCLFTNVLGLRRRLLLKSEQSLTLHLDSQKCDSTAIQILRDLIDERRAQGYDWKIGSLLSDEQKH